MKEFGIVIACCRRDFNFAKGCCASVRYFLGDIPICLIVDGSFSTRSLEKTYSVCVIKHDNIIHQVLRERSFGWGLTKMIAFWESPFEKFLFLDADTVVWGNVLRFADCNDSDIVIDQPYGAYSNETTSKFFFDIKGIETHFPSFQWRDRPYFVSGVFVAKKGIFELDEYVDLLNFNAKKPGIFKYGEQGILNFMTFRAADEGRVRLASRDMQTLIRRHSQNELEERFPLNVKGPDCKDREQEASVIHWAGFKPYIVNTGAYSKPMQFFRQKFLTDSCGLSGLLSEALLMIEDFRLYRPKSSFLKKVFHSGLKRIA
jgi:hypothetical protein